MKTSRIVLSVATVLLILAGLYFFTDLLGDREARKTVEETPVETENNNVQVRTVPPQIANDPDAGVLINDQNIQMEREGAESVSSEMNGQYMQGDNAVIVTPTAVDTMLTPTPAGVTSSENVEEVEGGESDADTPAMSIPPVPDM